MFYATNQNHKSFFHSILGIFLSTRSRLSEINPIRDELSTGSIGNSLFENSLHNKQYSMSPSLLNNSSISDIRLRDEFSNQSTKHLPTPWEEQIVQVSKACEAWKSEADESNRKV